MIGHGWNIFNLVTSGDDFSGDGHADLLARANDGALWLYPGNGTGGFLSRRQIGSGWNAFTSFSSVGNFSGSGTPGVIGRAHDGTLWLYNGSGSGSFRSVVLHAG